MSFVPQGEGEQPPELAAAILTPGDVVVQQACNHLGTEEALAVQRFSRERLPRKRLEFAPEPGARWDREPALLAVDDLAWQQRGGCLPQQHLLREAADLVQIGRAHV